jgi:two-component system cell cycle response regulator DivK
MATNSTAVLIVDDNEHIRAILAQILRAYGYEAMEAKTGIEAIEKTNSMKPDLVLMDINLPDMTGADAARAIKKNSSTRTIPVIGCSAFIGSQYRDAALSAGMVDYLVKPVSVDLFTAKIAQFLHVER